MVLNKKMKIALILIFALLVLLIMHSKSYAANSTLTIKLDKTSYPYTGSKIKPNFTLYYGGVQQAKMNYDITYGNNIYCGTAHIIVQSKTDKDLIATANFEIIGSKKNVLAMNLSSYTYTYSGKQCRPDVTLYLDGKLQSNKNYNISYINNINAGPVNSWGSPTQKTAIVTATHKKYSNLSTSMSFSIEPVRDINAGVYYVTASYPSNNNQFVYNGKVQKPTPIVTDVKNGITLVNGKDYDLSYKDLEGKSNFTDAGTKYCIIKLKNNYFGKIGAEYEITPKKISSSDININKSCTFDPGKKSLYQYVDEFLKNSKLNSKNYHATLESSSNDIIGEKTLRIRGQNNYTGELTYTVTIKKLNISKYSFSSPELVLAEKYRYGGVELKTAIPLTLEYNGDIIKINCPIMPDNYYDSIKKTYTCSNHYKNNYFALHGVKATFIYNVQKSILTIILEGDGNLEGKKTITLKNVIDSSKTYKKGDVNGDGKIDSADARLVLRMSVGMETSVPAADMDSDGKVTSADARLVLRKSVGYKD